MTPLPDTLLPATLLRAADGTPRSDVYDDVYHSAAGALGQARHVFLAGNGLPERWRGRERFAVLETGFGLGGNFLATWAAWRADAQRCERLHFVSCEKHPFTAADIAAVHATLFADADGVDEATDAAVLAPLAARLRAQWPQLVPGFQRLHFDEGRVTLTLLLGDAVRLLPQLDPGDGIDAFFLDGFSPAKNPDLWSPALLGQLARLAAPGATLATWSVAAGVREALAASGWQLDKAPGFAGKRDMLRGRRPGAANPAGRNGRIGAGDRRAIVVGAGLAGTSAAERLAARGWRVDLIEQAEAPGQGASGNRAGVLRPLPSLDDNRLARLTRAAFLYTRQHCADLAEAGLPLRWGPVGVLHLARDDVHEATQRRVVDTLRPPAGYLRHVDRDEAGRLAGWPAPAGGWWFPGGAWVQPPSLCRANLARHGERIRTRFGVRATAVERIDGGWRVCGEDGRPLAEAPVLILANATDACRLGVLPWLPLRAARGQVTHLPAAEADSPPRVVVCRLGYVTPAVDGVRSAGATFLADDTGTVLRPAEHAENLAKLDFILPGYTAALTPSPDPATLDGRVGCRPVSPDRLPMVGPLADTSAIDPAHPPRVLADLPALPGLCLIDGFGARGLVWSALAGELLASHIAGDPLPLETELAAAVDPRRFLLPGRRRTVPRDTAPDA
ncbi:bifunctional tRNA (5-methylaminomethyl-2-thiouridine)(34)-methyltransferase MnmD/FAD-dependent 5-carboxymethylaminomethyl-2-thiouridine(34) oxidoreductase MnmC [Stella sp.]|uniref:bifunctional tRNA (5-methylaminomethyl-2-thiouridine)(34)-methyltransferase MnmD/FAD-dependent 5-carboxymethylaminomethyl-2-thiouridine(34) oxidoreductase MnmC n=1 Tax=Stella sp. TaxID=2912054 RepID=UPI0035AF1B90